MLPHFIHRDDVGDYLRGSSLSQPVWHATHPVYAESFRRDGPRVRAGASSGVVTGFYCSVRPWERRAESDIVFEVAVRSAAPFRIASMGTCISDITGSGQNLLPDEAREELLARRHDCVICDSGVVVVLVESIAKLIYPHVAYQPTSA